MFWWLVFLRSPIHASRGVAAPPDVGVQKTPARDLAGLNPGNPR
jgi:hypothetical protein